MAGYVYLAIFAVRRVTLRCGCHNTPLSTSDPATLPPFTLLLLVLDTRFTAAARVHTLRRRKRDAEACEDVITKLSILPKPGPARHRTYKPKFGRSICITQSCLELFPPGDSFLGSFFPNVFLPCFSPNSICPHFTVDVIFKDDSI